jgi:hypothetical protein
MPALPKLHLYYVLHEKSIKYGSYTLSPHLQVRLEKVCKTVKQGLFEKIPKET